MSALDEINKTLEGMGLSTSPFPGVMVPLLFWFIVLESLAATFSLSKLLSIPAPLFQTGLIVLSALLALIAYTAGAIWDATIFDPLYGLNGKWLTKRKRPFALFPAGSDLERYRHLAVDALLPTNTKRISANGEGVYRVAKEKLIESGQWNQASLVLSWSKAFRSLIVPLLLTGMVCFCFAIGSFLSIWVGNAPLFLLIAVACLVFALFSFIPYLEWRIEHMIKMYDLVSPLS